MLAAYVVLIIAVSVGCLLAAAGVGQWRRRKTLTASLTSLRTLRVQAEEMAQHAVDNGLTAEPWYRLAEFWERLGDYEPEIVYPRIMLVEATPKEPIEPLEQHSWVLRGTDEDAYVIKALRRHGVEVEVIGPVGHMTGTGTAIRAAEADYRYDLIARRATG